MIKLLAGVTVVAALGMAGLSVADSLVRRTRELKSLRGALSQLETEISYGLTPLPTAWRNVSRRTQGPVHELFAEAAVRAAPPLRLLPEEAWAGAIAKTQRRFSFRGGDWEILFALGAGMGRSHREDQLRILRLAREQLLQAESDAEENRRRSQRLWSYSGFLVGVLVAILAM